MSVNVVVDPKFPGLFCFLNHTDTDTVTVSAPNFVSHLNDQSNMDLSGLVYGLTFTDGSEFVFHSHYLVSTTSTTPFSNIDWTWNDHSTMEYTCGPDYHLMIMDVSMYLALTLVFYFLSLTCIFFTLRSSVASDYSQVFPSNLQKKETQVAQKHDPICDWVIGSWSFVHGGSSGFHYVSNHLKKHQRSNYGPLFSDYADN